MQGSLDLYAVGILCAIAKYTTTSKHRNSCLLNLYITLDEEISMTKQRKTSINKLLDASVIESINNVEQLDRSLSLQDKKSTEVMIIYLTNNFTENLTLDFLDWFPETRTFGVVGGRYGEIDLTACKKHKSLDSVFVSNNSKIKCIDIRPLLDNPNIRNIELSGIKNLRNVIMDNITSCNSLISLILLNDNVYANELTPDLALIGKCSNLQKLVITTNEKDIDLTSVMELKNLVHLTMVQHVKPHWLSALKEHSSLFELPIIDGTPLLSMPKLKEFNYQVRGIYSHILKLAGRIKLPEVVANECGAEWYRVNKFACLYPPTIAYENIDLMNWLNTYQELRKYVLSFSHPYWHSLNKYILDLYKIKSNIEGIDISQCIIPSDLFHLISPEKDKKSNATAIKEGISKSIDEMVERYLSGGHSTSGFDVDYIESNNTRFDSLVPMINEIRDAEVQHLSFYQLTPGTIENEQWMTNPNYYIHSLRKTVHGLQLLKDRDLSIPDSRGRYVLSLTEIKDIEEHFNISGIKTNWEFIEFQLWTSLMY